MAHMKERLWGIISGVERAPIEAEVDKFVVKRDRVVALVMLSVDPFCRLLDY